MANELIKQLREDNKNKDDLDDLYDMYDEEDNEVLSEESPDKKTNGSGSKKEPD